MKQLLKRFAARVANTQLVRSLVVNLVYPSIVRCILSELHPDERSPSGVVESLAWKIHSYVVMAEEFGGGKCCYGDVMNSTRESRRTMLDQIQELLRDV